MNSVNYPVFELLKYKIDFLDCLEFCLPFYEIEENNIINKLDYLNKEFKEGTYRDIISSLFTKTSKINKPLKSFLNKYNSNKIISIINKNKISYIVKYYENLIDINETFNMLIDCFLQEKEIKDNLNSTILELIDVSKEHFTNFLLFASYSLFINEHNLKLIKIINFCDTTKTYLKAIQSEKEEVINDKLTKLSLKCIDIEKKQTSLLKSIIDMINNISKE